jgi:hypothetical protein
MLSTLLNAIAAPPAPSLSSLPHPASAGQQQQGEERA